MSNTYSDNKLHRVGKTLMHQLDLYRQLASVEWKEEKGRLTGMLISLFLGFAFFSGLLFVLTSSVLMFSWDTPYRIGAVVALLAFYALGLWFAWYRFKTLDTQGSQAFSDTREELAVDVALLATRPGLVPFLATEVAPFLLGRYLAKRKRKK